MKLGASYIQFLTMAFRTKPSRFLRQLVFNSGLIPLEDVAGCTVMGRKGQETPVVSLKLQSLMGKLFLNVFFVSPNEVSLSNYNLLILDFTVRTCGLKEKTFEMADFQKKIANVCCDARKKLKAAKPTC